MLQPEDGTPVPLQGAQLVGRRLVSHPGQTPGSTAAGSAPKRPRSGVQAPQERRFDHFCVACKAEPAAGPFPALLEAVIEQQPLPIGLLSCLADACIP